MARTSFARYLATLAACACAFFGSASADEKPANPPGTYTLEYHYQPGKFVHYETSHQQTCITRYGEREINNTKGDIKYWKHYRVVAVDAEGNGILETQIDRAVMQASDEAAGTEHTFDSRDGMAKCPQAFRPVMEGVGRPHARMTISPSGKLIDLQALPGPSGQAKQHGLEDDVRGNFLIPLPENPVKIGDSWSDDFEVFVGVQNSKLRRPVRIHRKYTLTAVEGQTATIGIRMGVLDVVHDPHILGQLISRTPQGTVKFDMQQGVITAKTLSTDKTELGALSKQSALRVMLHLEEKMVPPPHIAEQPTQSQRN